MIATFNRKQMARAILAIFLGLIAAAITIGFFYGALRMVFEGFDLDDQMTWIPVIVGAALVVIFYSGWDLWRRGFGQQDFSESSFGGGFDNSTASGVWANVETFQARGCATAISQIALASPLQFLKAHDLIRSRIAPDRGLESTLKDLLRKIEAKDRWHPIAEYRGRETEVMYLVRMGIVEFSARKGLLRPKN